MQDHSPQNSAPETAHNGEIRSGRPKWDNAQQAINRIQRKHEKRVAEENHKTRAETIEAIVWFNEKFATILLVVVSGATVMLTYFGVSVPMSELGGGTVQKGQSLVFGITVGVLSTLAWPFLFGLSPWLTGWRLFSALAAGTTYILAIACIDAPFNMVALGGGSAVQMSMVDTARHYELHGREQYERSTAAARTIPALRAEWKRFGQSSEHEVRTGGNTGKAGVGKVSGGYAQIAMLLGSLADELEGGRVKADELLNEYGLALGELKKHVYTPGEIRARVEATSKAADRLDAISAQLSQVNYAVSIRATLASLESIFPISDQAGNAFEKVQNAELGVVAGMAKSVAQALRTSLNDLAPASGTSERPLRPQDPMTAIKTYWKPLLPQWIAAIFIDLAPGLLLIMLLAGRREAELARRNARKDGERS